ncbi:DUF6894 family protein [Methylobacterium soli]
MSRYFFDLHRDCLTEWDDEGTECDGSEGVLHHALELLRAAAGAEPGQQSASTVTARDNAGHVVLTATKKPRTGASVRWAGEQLSSAAPIFPLPSGSASAP